MEYNHLSWNDVEQSCLSIYSQMLQKNYRPDCIIGLLRGGVVPARIFSDYFDILLDFYALDVKLYDGINSRKKEPEIKSFYGNVEGKRVLVVDDIWDSGKTMRAVLAELKDTDITTATLFWKETADGKPDYFARYSLSEEWIIFPWESCEFGREKDK